RALFGLTQQEIAARTGWTDDSIVDIAKREEADGHVKIVSSSPLLLVGQKGFMELKARVIGALEAFHNANPLSPGIPREDLRAQAARRIRPEVFRAALEELAREERLILQGEIVKRTGAAVTLLPEEQRARDQIETAFAGAGLAVPPVKE